MNYKKLSKVLFLLVIISPLMFAQITVQQSNLQSILVPGDSINALFSSDTLMDVGQTGGPNIYDLRQLNYNSAKLAMGVGSSFPLAAPHFPNDTVLAGPFNYNVVFFPGNEMQSPGHINIVNDTTYKVNVKTPGEVLFDFPVTYNKSWSYSYTSYDTTYQNGKPISSAVGGDSRKTTVDGYGTLILPNGDSLACLRLFQGPASGNSGSNDSAFTFIYVTQTGTFVFVDAPGNQPTTGKITIQDVQVIEGSIPTSVQAEQNLPASFALYQNYPNPFNPTTTIKYQIPNSSHVTLKVYDILGREVATLVNEVQNAGEHSVQFPDRQQTTNYRQVSSGIYFYRLTAGASAGSAAGFTEVKKLVLLK